MIDFLSIAELLNDLPPDLFTDGEWPDIEGDLDVLRFGVGVGQCPDVVSQLLHAIHDAGSHFGPQVSVRQNQIRLRPARLTELECDASSGQRRSQEEFTSLAERFAERGLAAELPSLAFPPHRLSLLDSIQQIVPEFTGGHRVAGSAVSDIQQLAQRMVSPGVDP